jgi:hypothetical protein
MSKNSKDKIRGNESSKQSKEESGTLTDYVQKRLEEEGMPVKRVKLPKDWTRVIFKRQHRNHFRKATATSGQVFCNFTVAFKIISVNGRRKYKEIPVLLSS